MFRRQPNTATEWLVRLNSGSISAGDRRALMRWLAADPERLKQLEAVEEVSRLAMDLGGSTVARDILAADLGTHVGDIRRRRLYTTAPLAIGAMAAAALLAFILMPSDPSALPRLGNHNNAHTVVGQIASYVLPDKSKITIAADSSVSVNFTGDRRNISLARGEAFFDVQHDAERPFVINSGAWNVTVVGTKFNVNTYATQTDLEVAVVEGRVNVSYRMPDGKDRLEQLAAGDVIYFPAKGPLRRRSLSPEQAAAWRSRKLYFDGAQLAQVLEELNRYAAKPLVPQSQDIEKLLLTGQFQAGDIGTVLTALHQLYGIEASETNASWVLTRAQTGPTRRN